MICEYNCEPKTQHQENGRLDSDSAADPRGPEAETLADANRYLDP